MPNVWSPNVSLSLTRLFLSPALITTIPFHPAACSVPLQQIIPCWKINSPHSLQLHRRSATWRPRLRLSSSRLVRFYHPPIDAGCLCKKSTVVTNSIFTIAICALDNGFSLTTKSLRIIRSTLSPSQVRTPMKPAFLHSLATLSHQQQPRA